MISPRAAEIFLEANTLDAETRARFVTDVCGKDAALLNEVQKMLAAANQSEDYFAELAGKVSLDALANTDDALPADKIIGQWRLLKRIGRGGMGAVYLAERADEQFEQQAALKILPTGLDTEEARARFLVERQILARLVHDNIARLLDGGVTDDGVPYFVMDYVVGLPVDQYCEQQSLDVEKRLALLLDIAKAVQFAHRNLIIHRDLKPNNVLVTENGQVRLLDFGIAKMLEPNTDSADLTKVTQRPATPAYSSPEMLRGEPVDITSDVYSLGALMHVLLTGQAPLRYDGMSLAEMCDHAATMIPRPMSAIKTELHADLDAIAAKALGKTPAERYESVERLADDIENFLAGLPIAAKTPSHFYRIRKFVGRHKVGTSFAVFAVGALAAITGLAVSSAIESDRQAEQIALERDRAEETTSFLISIFDSADPNIEPGNLTATEILEAGRERLESELAEQPAVQAELLKAIGEVHQSFRQNDKARDVFERERELRGEIDTEENAEYANVLIRLAQVADLEGDYEASLGYSRQALSLSEKLKDEMGQAAAHTRIGRVLHLQGDYDGAGEGYRAALALYQQEYGDDSEKVSKSREHLGNLYRHQGKHNEAIAEFKESLRVRRMLFEGDSSNISVILLGLGHTLSESDEHDDAEEMYETAFAMNDRLYGPDNSYNLFVLSGLGKLALMQGDFNLAVSRLKNSIRLINMHMPDSPNLGIAYASLGKAHAAGGQNDLAIDAYRRAVGVLEEGLPDHWYLGDARWRLGQCLTQIGDYEEAEPLILAGLEIVAAQWGAEDERTIEARSAAAMLYESWGEPEKAALYQAE